jgi:hypothetical protein
MIALRTPLQVCNELAAVLTAESRIPAICKEIIEYSPNGCSQESWDRIIRDRLRVSGVPADRAEGFIEGLNLARRIHAERQEKRQ